MDFGVTSLEPSIEKLIEALPPVIEYYTGVNGSFTMKQWANIKLTCYGEDGIWYASYRESDFDGDKEHIEVYGFSLREALINLRKALNEFPSKFENFMWVTQSEIDKGNKYYGNNSNAT